MAITKHDFKILVGFDVQSAEGTYSTVLDPIGAGTWDGDPDATDQGLMLGDPGSGEGESGISFVGGRRSRDTAVLEGGFTRSISDWLAAEVRSFSFAFPFGASKRTTTAGAPVDADFVPTVGQLGILNAFGLDSSAWGAGVGQSIKFAAGLFPCSALLFYFGNRLELLDCRGDTLAITYTPGGIAIANATFSVGSIKDPVLGGVPFTPVVPPTPDYGTQASQNNQVVETVGNIWGTDRGFSELTITITNTIDDTPDSNAIDGIVKEATARETKVEATLFSDSGSSEEVSELEQLFADAIGDLDNLSFTVGTAAAALAPALAHKVIVPDLEVDEVSPVKIGSKAGMKVTGFARSATLNEELEIQLI